MREDRGKLGGGKVLNVDRLHLVDGDLGSRLASGADRATITGKDVFATVRLARTEGATSQLDTCFLSGCANLALAIIPRNRGRTRGRREKSDFHRVKVLGRRGATVKPQPSKTLSHMRTKRSREVCQLNVKRFSQPTSGETSGWKYQTGHGIESRLVSMGVRQAQRLPRSSPFGARACRGHAYLGGS